MRRKWVSQADLNHKKYGSKWNLTKAKKFFKAIFGTDKFVEPHPFNDHCFFFKNDFVCFEAFVLYGSSRIQLQTINPHNTIGYFDFVTYQLDRNYTSEESDRRWQEVKKEITYDYKDHLHSLSIHNTKQFEKEIQKIKDLDF
ncbi:hypothetical protein [Cohnella abietis]|uniref:Uncharacterized protein n=1 Tax=Cohnella abietis TaxID=2507935 RepID=A0A3T1D1M6_9BACL|nr:hypothetical protein [Cohnella abietis]BBI32013.1 hypothetical protein KCTCHS21_14120 [Cohnella abietis]